MAWFKQINEDVICLKRVGFFNWNHPYDISSILDENEFLQNINKNSFNQKGIRCRVSFWLTTK
jgi:hypothetical protein